MTCRWDREAEAYLVDGEPCRTDDYGDPTYHCKARKSCASHIGRDELTCPRCVGRVRFDIRAIVLRAPELLPEALIAGVDSQAANLAGPAADAEAWSWRKVAARQGRSWHASLIEDDDDYHPYTVLTRWEFLLREDYKMPRPPIGCAAPVHPTDRREVCEAVHEPGCWNESETPTSLSSAADYLERVLPRVAQDPEQDFGLLRDEIRKCRQHLEAVLRDSQTPERGAPCPVCVAPAPRLALEHGHWCDEPDCDRIHYPADPDRWVCPRDRAHAWEEDDYRRWVADVYEAQRGA